MNKALQNFEACESGTYDVILMDVMMPVMDGLTATKTIRSGTAGCKNNPYYCYDCKRIVLAAARMEAGMNAHLAKPAMINNQADYMRRIEKQ